MHSNAMTIARNKMCRRFCIFFRWEFSLLAKQMSKLHINESEKYRRFLIEKSVVINKYALIADTSLQCVERNINSIKTNDFEDCLHTHWPRFKHIFTFVWVMPSIFIPFTSSCANKCDFETRREKMAWKETNNVLFYVPNAPKLLSIRIMIIIRHSNKWDK